MNETDIGRNLLFGLLALQNNLIERQPFLAAFQQWTHEKHRGIDEILIENGLLNRSDCQLLADMMQQYIQQHQGDVQHSLASLSSIGSVRDELAPLVDSEMAATLEFVADPLNRERDRKQRSPSAGELTVAGQRFRIIRPHAKGGLGEVFVAQDLQLRREVAVKEIQARFADQPDRRSRFLLEAEITGGLEHPGIVPVYGLGQYADGRPYYAMRFIRGDSLREAIDRFHKADVAGRDLGERTLELRRLLGRFIDVCEAIAYAHSRGVLHRDLKPGNILLGKYGETLVVDWGLAKVAGSSDATGDPDELKLQPSSSGSEPTACGAAIGTPAYMSPEQASGRLDLLGPASDVYGLGATLYHLLTGSVPVTGGDVAEVLSKVKNREIQPAVERNPRVPKALSAICEKAMAREPADRYASPRELADDLEHWLADEPISCMAEPLSVRARRWIKRHRTLVASSAAALTVLFASLIVVLALSTRHNRALDAKNKQLDNSNNQLTKANKDLVAANAAERAAKQEAEQKRTEAETARDDTRQVLNYLVGAFRKPDPSLDGGKLTVAELLDQAVTEVDTSFSGQPLLRAHMLNSIGETYSGLGLFAKAVDAHQKALQIREPQLPPEHEDLLTSKNNLAIALSKSGRGSESIPLLLEVLEVQKQATGSDQRLMLRSMNNLAEAYRTAGKPFDAIRVMEEALALMKSGLGEEDADTLVAMDNLGNAYHAVGRFEDAIKLIEAAHQAFEKKLGADDALTIASMMNLAAVYVSARDPQHAIPLLEKSLERTTSKFGHKHSTRLSALNNLAFAYTSVGRVADAIGLLEPAVEIAKEQLGPTHADTLNMMVQLSGGYRASGRREDSLKLLEQAVGLMKQSLSVENPLMIRSMFNLGFMYREDGKFVEAAALQAEALEQVKQGFGEEHPDTLAVMMGLADTYLFAGQPAAAIPLLQDLLRIHKKLSGDDVPQVLSAATRLAECYRLTDRHDEAIELFEQIRDTKVRIYGPEHPETLPTLANLAGAYFSAGRIDEALQQFSRVHELMSASLGPDHLQTITAQANLAATYEGAGRIDEAISQLSAAMQSMRRVLGPRHIETLTMMQRLGRVYWKARRFDESVPLFEESHQLLQEVYGDDHLVTLEALSNLGVNYADAGRPDEGVQRLQDALARIRQLPPSFRPKFAWVVSELVRVLEESKQWEKAEPLRREMLAATELAVGSEALDYAAAAEKLAANLVAQQKFAEAEPLLRQAVDVRELKAPEDRPVLRESLQKLIELYTAWDKPDQAAEWQRRLDATPQ